MRRLALVTGGCLAAAAAVAVTLAAGSSPSRSLPLRSPAKATSSLSAVVSDQFGSRLERIDPATFAALHASSRVAWQDGWVRSPGGKLLAVSTNPQSSNVSFSTLHFASASSLRWQGHGIRLHGYFQAAIWPRRGTLYALVGNCCGPGLTLERIDTAARKIVARTGIPGPVLEIERSATGLVLLEGGEYNEIAPARLLAIGADGSVRSVRLDQIVAGLHWDQSSQDPIGTIRQPGLAVDASGGVAYVLDPDGLVATVQLADLSVAYHRLGSHSLLDRLSAWFTPAAEAKGANGPTLTARWLGDGLIALTGNDETATPQKDGTLVASSRPLGLRIVDTSDWSSRLLDPEAGSVLVADGVLLASGSSWSSDATGNTSSGEGIAAYNPDGSLRWRRRAGAQISLIAAYGNRAVVQNLGTATTAPGPLQLVDTGTGRAVRTLRGATWAWLLLGSGSAQP
ncbi:MAG TPA: hypothetical protein VJ814_06005 [Gaiellaceae bacterium]|nr:hypothetical protein [Gaiellaceae bacterium]